MATVKFSQADQVLAERIDILEAQNLDLAAKIADLTTAPAPAPNAPQPQERVNRGVPCGKCNRGNRGDKIYHANSAAVRACYGV